MILTIEGLTREFFNLFPDHLIFLVLPNKELVDFSRTGYRINRIFYGH